MAGDRRNYLFGSDFPNNMPTWRWDYGFGGALNDLFGSLGSVLACFMVVLVPIDIDIATHIHINDDGPKRSLLYIETADKPGLLMEIIKILADINDLVAKDKFHVSYRSAALNDSLSQVLMNCLRYYLRRSETDEDSY